MHPHRIQRDLSVLVLLVAVVGVSVLRVVIFSGKGSDIVQRIVEVLVFKIAGVVFEVNELREKTVQLIEYALL